jgi:predicted permease
MGTRRKLEEWGCRLFAILLRLLPEAVRERAGDGMLHVLAERQREAREAGALAVLGVTLRELGGVVGMAWRVRHPAFRPVPRTRRTGSPRVSPSAVAGDVLQDVRFAVRAARRRPAPYALALAATALGIGAGTAMYSVVDGVLLRPLPYPDPDRVVSVYPTIEEWREHPTLSASWDRASWSYPEFVDWRRVQTSFAEAAVYGMSSATLTGNGEPARVGIGRASEGLFRLLGAEPIIGRAFSAEDVGRGTERVIVLTHAFWQTRFGGSPDAIGSTLYLDGGPRRVIGVLPPRFHLTGLDAAAWMPIEGDETGNRDDHNLNMVARLAAAVTVERAQAETSRVLETLSASHDASETTHRAHIVPRLADDTRQVRQPLLLLLAGAGLLLLVACVNVAALLLGAGIDRGGELVVRGAMGASRVRLMRQLVVESLVLAFAGGALGLLLANVLVDALVLLAPAGVPRMEQARLDTRVLLLSLVATSLVGFCFGLLPALAVTRSDVSGHMRGAHTTGTRHRLHRALVVMQIALAAVLLTGAGMLARTLARLDAVQPGFDPEGILTVRIAPPFQRFTQGGEFDAARYDRYFEDVATALSRVRGVAGVAITSGMPYSGDRANNEIEPEGYTPAPGELLVAARYAVSWNYMSLMRMRIVEGRGFTVADDGPGAAPVTIVTRNLARRFWPGESPLGRTITFWRGTFTIVGVIDDVRDRSLAEGDELRYYMPRGQFAGQGGSFMLRVDPAADAEAVASLVRAAVWSVDAGVPVTSVMPLTQRIASSLSEERYRARLMSAFAALAMVLSLLGVYGVTSRGVASRTREIGVRLALGQPHGRILMLVLRDAVALSVAGVIVGAAASIMASGVLASFLYGSAAIDLATLCAVASAFIASTMLAALAPSFRAARIHPSVALRAE